MRSRRDISCATELCATVLMGLSVVFVVFILLVVAGLELGCGCVAVALRLLACLGGGTGFQFFLGVTASQSRTPNFQRPSQTYYT